MYENRYETLQFETLKYLITYPNGYEKGKKYPVILQLHGAGGRGMPVLDMLGHPYFTLTGEMEGFPFVTVAPVCHENTWFDLFETLKRFAQWISASEYCDPERFYVMGGSLGGYTTWQLAMSLPDLFAAIVPICGGGMYWNAARLVNVPVWAFHGAKDTTVFPEESEKMVNAVNKRGGNARLTIYPENGHDAWSDTFRNPEVYGWMLSHKKQNGKAIIDEFVDLRKFG
ncbi:MAG: prolyl oligopeptidase family serine peptidase [Clostridia bacterium]|nr:prolyl oligopeptidase family serine peptidase [Clostridia bacterium]